MTAGYSDPATVFTTLSRALATRDWNAAAELYASNAVVTNRFDPNGPTTKTGREAVREFFAGLGEKLDSLTIEKSTLTPGSDGETLVAEFNFTATVGSTKFELPAIFVMRIHKGQIIESRDYIGPRQA